MNIAILRDMLRNYFGFNYGYAFAVAIVICCIILLLLNKRQKNYKREFTKKDVLFLIGLILYLTLMIGFMILNREPGERYQMNLTLFWSYRKFFSEGKTALQDQMVFNILAFIPWPILFALVFPKMKKFLWGMGSAFLFSMCIEVTQLVFKLGMFEFDDMFHNTLGALIGYAILRLFMRLKKKGENK